VNHNQRIHEPPSVAISDDRIAIPPAHPTFDVGMTLDEARGRRQARHEQEHVYLTAQHGLKTTITVSMCYGLHGIHTD